MDTSKEYIKMCDCEEIQKNWSPVVGDFCWDTISKMNYILQYKDYELAKKEGRISAIEGCIWLPRQDQSQKMIFEINNGIPQNIGLQTMCTAIEQFSKSEYGSRFTINGSMEQLWLGLFLKTYNHLR